MKKAGIDLNLKTIFILILFLLLFYIIYKVIMKILGVIKF